MLDPDPGRAARHADVLIVGAGVAGCAAAYFASLKHRKCLVIDAGIDCASTVPTALINPVRGYQAKHSEEGIDGARCTFALIDALRAAGHPIVSGRGLWRPVEQAEQRDLWKTQLPTRLGHQWSDGELLKPLLHGQWLTTLYLPDSGWVETASLLRALRNASGAEFLTGHVTGIEPAVNAVVLDNGERIVAETLLWCGGAWGAAKIAGAAHFRPGSVVVTEERLFDDAVSFGLYSAPHGTGSVLGPTTESQYANYPPAWDANAPLQRLIERARELFRPALTPKAHWRGVRLESASLPRGLRNLGHFGSRGYLLAPRAAQRWADLL